MARDLEIEGLEGPDRVLVPVAPLLYVAWADGVLTGDEIRRIRELIEAQPWIGDDATPALDRWLDPSRPPSPLSLAALLASLRRAARRLSADDRRSLASLGEGLARAQSGGEPLPDVRRALDDIERALGVVGSEAVRVITGESAPETESALPAAAAEAAPDVAELGRLIEPHDAQLRRRVFDLLARPEFRVEAGLETGAYRRRVMEWLHVLADEGLTAFAYPPEQGGGGDIGRSITVFRALACGDQSLLVKYGVQFGLFGGSILHLGTEKHHERWLRDIATLRLPGCYAMTEVAHGSNVRQIRTTARYDPHSDELVVDTPDDDARKEWIGNAALHGRMATVFAQLEVGGECVGVHAVVVPLRDDAGRTLPGVEIEDCGEKEGLNGVDNGRIRFRSVRVPRDHLLDRFGRITDDGAYESPIPSAGRRFFTMLGTLVAGRISIAAAAGSAAEVALSLAIRYTDRRRQFGPEGGPEVPVLDYLSQQRRLLPRLATSWALHVAMDDLIGRYAAVRPGDAPDREIEVLAAGLKAYGTAHTVETLQQCRQACGGHGYLAANRFGRLLADTDVFTTFEGANLVLLQLVAKGLLTGFREQFEELRVWAAARWVGHRAATVVSELNPIVTRRTDEAHLRDPDFQLAALRYREERLLSSAVRRLRHRLGDGTDSFAAINELQDHLVTLATAHVERVLLEHMVAAIDDVRDGVAAATETTLERLRALFALTRIEADRGWFLENGYLEGGKAKAIRSQVNRLCAELRPDALALVAALDIPDAVLDAPILTLP